MPGGGVFGDMLSSITVASNHLQKSTTAIFLGSWNFSEGDENTLWNGYPFFFETFDTGNGNGSVLDIILTYQGDVGAVSWDHGPQAPSGISRCGLQRDE